MTIAEILKYCFGLLACGSALAIVFTNNLIRGAFYLVVCLLCLAAVYVLYMSTFLAVVQVMIYAGGVLVLIAFGIMLTNRSMDGKVLSKNHLMAWGIVCSAVFLFMFFFSMREGMVSVGLKKADSSQIETIGMGFMTRYILAFELVAYLLLVVMVGAAFYAKNSNNE